jgi:hypothetical protein
MKLFVCSDHQMQQSSAFASKNQNLGLIFMRMHRSLRTNHCFEMRRLGLSSGDRRLPDFLGHCFRGIACPPLPPISFYSRKPKLHFCCQII